MRDWLGIAAMLGVLALVGAYFLIWGIEGHYPIRMLSGGVIALVCLAAFGWRRRPDEPVDKPE